MKNISFFIIYILKNKLIILGLLIYTLFNISTLTNHFLDFFFFGSSIHHCCQGLDFYQIPNGVYAFLHGGELNGNIPSGINPYALNYQTNINVYHPLFTLIIGYLLIFFKPDSSILIWTLIKIPITLITIYYIFINFRENKFLSFSIFIFLLNFSQYNDIRISQYQFLFNIFLVYLLINILKNKDKLTGGILFFLTLIAKPVGIIWIPVLIIKKQYKIFILGFSLFLISTYTFNVLNVGQYFTDNLFEHLTKPLLLGGIDLMSLDSLLRNGLGLSENFVKSLKFISLGLIYLLAFNKRVSLLKIIFLLIVHFLFFYDLIYQYHFSVLGPVMAICVLALPEFQNKISKILITLISLPTIFFILRIFNYQIVSDPREGINPTPLGWEIVSVFQLLPIILLTIIVLVPDLKFYLSKISRNAAI